MRNYVILFAFAFAMINIASAATQINIYIENDGKAEFLGYTDDGVILPSGVSVENGQIKGKTSELTTKTGELWTFAYSLSNTEMTIHLPDESVIRGISDGDISTRGGNIIIDVKDNINVSYVVLGEPFNMIGVFVIIIVVAGTLGYYYFKKKKRPRKPAEKRVKNDKHTIVRGILNDRENLILDNLKKLGKAKMSYLRKACDIPKASFSRHIRELERKKLIKLSGDGKNKIVEIR